MEKTFMVKLGKQSVFFLEIYCLNSLRYNGIEHISAAKNKNKQNPQLTLLF